MGRRHPGPRRVKLHRSYPIDEAARCTGTHRKTVRAWIKGGLHAIEGRPTLILGRDLREFLDVRRRQAKQPLGPGEIYCLKCRAPKRPGGNMVDYVPLSPA